MCQKFDEKLTAEVRERLEEGQITAWKVVQVINDEPISLLFSFYEWKPGTNNAKNTRKLKVEVDQPYIHVFVDKKDAEEEREFSYDQGGWIRGTDNLQIMEVTCRKEHFIEAGYDLGNGKTAMFKQVELSREEYDKATRRV